MLLNSGGSTPCDLSLPPPRETNNPPHMHSRRVCQTDPASGALVWKSFALPWCLCVEDSLSSIMGVGGYCPQEGFAGAVPPAFNNVVTDSVYIIHILPHNFPGTFHALPAIEAKIVTYEGVFMA